MKIAYFEGGESQSWDLSYNEQLELAQKGIMSVGNYHAPAFYIVLVPDDTDLTTLTGDDWNDAPADINAGVPTNLPVGSVILKGQLGGHIKRTVKEI